jgi:hypothetical protein
MSARLGAMWDAGISERCVDTTQKLDVELKQQYPLGIPSQRAAVASYS